METSAAASATLSMIESTSEAAFASDAQGRIVAWNRGAEQLFGVPASQALGRACHDVVAGVDVFGNPYCGEGCPVARMAPVEKPIRRFALDVRSAAGEFVRADVLTVVQRRPERNAWILVHFLLLRSELQREIEITGRDREPPTCDADATGAGPEARPTLTQRETEILGLLANGARPIEIANELGISIHTVRSHIRRIHNKLEVHGTMQAVLSGLRGHLI